MTGAGIALQAGVKAMGDSCAPGEPRGCGDPPQPLEIHGDVEIQPQLVEIHGDEENHPQPLEIHGDLEIHGIVQIHPQLVEIHWWF